MKMNIEVPYEMETLALLMGVTPKEAAEAILGWYARPLVMTGILEAPPESEASQELQAGIDLYAGCHDLRRIDAVHEMRRSVEGTPRRQNLRRPRS